MNTAKTLDFLCNTVYIYNAKKENTMKYFYMLLISAMFSLAGCTTMLPAEDIKIYEVCQEEIAILKNPRIPKNSKEKYEAAVSLSKKVDFSYTRTVKFLSSIFLDSDARVNHLSESSMIIIMYYPYKDNFISFEFHRYNDQILKTVVKYK